MAGSLSIGATGALAFGGASVIRAPYVSTSPTRRSAAVVDGIRPFHMNVPEEQLVDLPLRIAATKWPERELVDDARGAPSGSRPDSHIT
jgi:hypothetical protein